MVECRVVQPPGSVLALCLHTHRGSGHEFPPSDLGVQGPEHLRAVKA